MTQSATIQAFSQLLKHQGREYTYDGFLGKGLPSGIETIQRSNFESGLAKAELIRVLRSAWSSSNFKVGGILTDVLADKDRRIADIDDDGTSDTLVIVVSID